MTEKKKPRGHAAKPFKKGNKQQRGRDPDKLTDKELLACKYFLAGSTQADSMRQAGYAEQSCTHQAHVVFGRDRVKKYIDEQREERNKRLDIDADYVLAKAVEIVERCMQEVKPKLTNKGEQIYDDDGHPVYIFNAPAALKGLELVGKHVGVNAFKEIVETTNKNIDIRAKMDQDKAREAIDQLLGNVDNSAED